MGFGGPSVDVERYVANSIVVGIENGECLAFLRPLGHQGAPRISSVAAEI
jgi:hypothetical protein